MERGQHPRFRARNPISEPLDVLLFDRTTESLVQENRSLKEQLARIKSAKPL
jgi:hypothetical protein